MAKRSNFRGTQRTLYTPRTVKYIETSQARKEYQALRRVALKRAARLRAAGHDWLNESSVNLPPSSGLDDDEIRQGLLDASRYLRDPYSLVSVVKDLEIPEGKELIQPRDRATYLRDIADMGPIINANRRRFGEFMEDIRARAAGRLYGSDQVRTAYEEAVKNGMRPETLRKHFSDYLVDAKTSDELANLLFNTKSEKRLTISKLQDLIDEAGIKRPNREEQKKPGKRKGGKKRGSKRT